MDIHNLEQIKQEFSGFQQENQQKTEQAKVSRFI